MRHPIVGQLRDGLIGVEVWDGTKWCRIESQQDRIERKLDQLIELFEARYVQPEPTKHFCNATEELVAALQDQIIRSKCTK